MVTAESSTEISKINNKTLVVGDAFYGYVDLYYIKIN